MDPKNDENIMTPSEKLACARDFRDITNENRLFAEEQGWILSNEFTRLEVQIAAILFGFVGVFLTALKTLTSDESFTNSAAFGMKLAFAAAMFFLLASLGLGLLHLKRNEKFWDEFLNQRIIRFWKWDAAVQKKISYEEAQAFHEGTTLHRGSIVQPPMWTWVLQSIFLGMAVTLLFVLSVIYLFT